MTRTEPQENVDFESQQPTNPHHQFKSNSPLFDVLFPILVELWNSIKQANRTLSEFNWTTTLEFIQSTITINQNILNMFNIRIFCIGFLLVLSIFNENPPSIMEGPLAVLLVGLGFYSRVYVDPLGMLVYSILNLCLLINSPSWIEQGQTPLILMAPFLLLNQIRSILCVLQYGKEKLKDL